LEKNKGSASKCNLKVEVTVDKVQLEFKEKMKKIPRTRRLSLFFFLFVNNNKEGLSFD
jgi:hypothetical protein